LKRILKNIIDLKKRKRKKMLFTIYKQRESEKQKQFLFKILKKEYFNLPTNDLKNHLN